MGTSADVHAGQLPPAYGYEVVPRNGGETLNCPTAAPRPPTPWSRRSPAVPALARPVTRSPFAPPGGAPAPPLLPPRGGPPSASAPGARASVAGPPLASSTSRAIRGRSLVYSTVISP